MHLRVESITPTKALKYLDTNHESQRHVMKRKVSSLAKMMIDGEFDGDNGETIKFAKNGKGDMLIDGQHRLLAVVEYGKPVQMAVIRGLKKESFVTLDQGIIRTVEHFYQIAGKSNAKVCSTVAKWLYYSEFGKTPLSWHGGGTAPLPGLVAEWGLEHYPDVPEVVEYVSDLLSGFQRKGLGTRNHLAYCYYKWQQVDPVKAFEYAQFLATGEGNVPLTIRSLREWLMQEARADKVNAIPGTKRGAKVINGLNTAWNAVQAGKKNTKAFSRLVSTFEKKMKTVTQGCNLVPAEIDVY